MFCLLFKLFRETELKKYRKKFRLLCPSEEHSETEIIDLITEIFRLDFRRYLKVYQLESGANLTNVIFRAVLESTNIYKTSSLE
jgi:hypothetical protein